MSWWCDFTLAAGLLTRLPLGRDTEPGALARAGRAMPLVGVLVGLLCGLAYWLALGLGLTTPLAAAAALAAGVLVTGALHEDGLADVADGFGGGATRERKLEIMHLSNVGTYGVLALAFSLALRAGSLSAIGQAGAVALALVAAHALARAAPPLLMSLLPLAREDGLAADVGRVEPAHAWTAAGLGAAIALAALGLGPGLLAILTAALALALVAALAKAQIGGYTGDVLGAAEQAAEAAVLLSLAALA